MKKRIIPILLVIVFANVLFFVVFKGKKAPEFPLLKTALQDSSGNTFNLQQNLNHATIISYFQSWCGDCRKELKELEALQSVVGGEQQLKIIMISDELWSNIDRVKITSTPTIQFYQAQTGLRKIGIRRFPTTYLIDKNAKVINAKVEGIHWNTKEIQDLIAELNQ